jgi:uncharacterized Tic20 family protein
MESRDQQIRTWSMLCHLSALASLLFSFGSILGPLIVWQIKKNDLPEIDPHGKESLNFQLTILLINIVCSFFLIGTIGFRAIFGNPFVLFTGGIGLVLVLACIRVVSWILVIVASIRAGNGELFNYPSIKFIR